MTEKTERRLFLAILAVGLIIGFIRFRHGAGDNWDGIFPYWPSQIPVWLKSLFSGWKETGLGAPVGYATGSLITLIYLPLYLLHLPTEVILYLTVGLVLAISSYLTFLLIRRVNNRLPFLLVALLAISAVVNPAIFYKLLAGHLYYLIGYLGLVATLLLLQVKPARPLVFSLSLGLLVALSACQIQFFIFTGTAVLVWLLINRRTYPGWTYCLAAGIVLLIHGYWIIGFLTGASSVSALSAWASNNSFDSLSNATLANVLRLNFSDATFINRFYGGVLSLVGFALVGLLPLGLALSRKVSRTTAFYLLLFIIGVYISTGAFQNLAVPGLKTLFPILREVGHAAPVTVLTLVLAIASLDWQSFGRLWRSAAVAVTAISVLLSLAIYWQYIPRIDFTQARQALAPFETENNQITETNRLLTYPFFNQYRFINQPQTLRKGTPMSNSGWDSFIIFSGHEYIDNAVPAIPTAFQSSIQYQFLQNYDTSVLKPFNVGYIYDLSAVYQSEFANFSAKEVYLGNDQLINNDPNFTTKILAANPNATLVAPGVIKLNDALPRLYSGDSTFKKLTSTDYLVTLNHLTDNQALNFLTAYHPGWRVRVLSPGNKVSCDQPISYQNGAKECPSASSTISGHEMSWLRNSGTVSGEHSLLSGYGNSYQLTAATINQANPQAIVTNADGSRSVTLEVYYQPQIWFLIFWLVSLLAVASTALTLIWLAWRQRLARLDTGL